MTIAIGNVYRDAELAKQFGVTLEPDLKYIYNALGIDVRFVYLPNERALRSANQGQYDALDLRIGHLENEENLVRVDVPLADMEIFLFSVGPEYYSHLSEIEDKVVAAHLGMRYVEKLKEYKKIYRVDSGMQGAMMLEKGRVDVWFAPKVMYLSLKDKFPQIKVASPVISYEPLYHYIHKSHAHLLPKLESAAKRLMQEKRPESYEAATQ
ncbi:transporter substrate-binding domain-containing protein [Vibrio sp. S4M6]|nr:transporter substrate-binding domain-containing protein [Vibrio sinus]MCL9780252.1 transporter substrate-binding domain-containing protein [Vibrio sinus]